MKVHTLSLVVATTLAWGAALACASSPVAPTPDEAPAGLAQAPSALLAGTPLGVAYSGYRSGQHPDRGQGELSPSREQIGEDLGILTRDGGFGLIRLYDSGALSATVLDVIAERRLPLKVVLGAWLRAEISNEAGCAWLTEPIPVAELTANKVENKAELDRAIALAKRYPEIVVAVNVGNEALVRWNDHLVDVDVLLAYARWVKAAIAQPVTTADNYAVFRDYGPRLAEVLDFFMVHTYPAWEGKDVDEALAYTVANLQSVRDVVPGARLVIGEAGWPSLASEFGDRASEAKQRRYYDELTAWGAANNVTTLVFEAFDEDWKGDPGDPLGAEKHWGLFTVDRKAKLVMQARYPDLVPALGPPSEVKIVPQGDGGYALERNGEPYVVKGVGGDWNLTLARSLGANSVRTWGEEDWPRVFERAHQLGMTVFAGIWLSHHPEDYDDEGYKAKKRAEVEALAKEWAGHPALLAWCLGNEIQLKANLPQAWRFVEELAQIIRRYDTRHPIATATAHSPADVLDLIVANAPSINLLAVNSYAGMPAVTRDIGRSRFRGPFVFTEWGPNGHWETGNTAWGRPLEQPSAEKVATYRERAQYFPTLPACVGAYVFLWGQKQERTPTWYSMFVERLPRLGLNGEATGAVDVVQALWSGVEPTNHAPVISELRLDGKLPADNLVVKPGTPLSAVATAQDADGDALTWVWELMLEPAVESVDGAHEARPPTAPDAVTHDGATAQLSVAKPGEYRLFAYCLDGKGKVGTASFPFKVEE